MARGWESKSVEEQQSVSTESAAKPTKEGIEANAKRTRQRQVLELERERILDERTSNPIRRRALEAALSEIEARLTQL